MADDTSAALKALIQQVSVLAETVGAQQKKLDGLHDFNARVLDEKKDLQRRLEQQTETDKQLADRAMSARLTATTTPKGQSPLTP